jgi:hypothetical protein
MGAKKISNQIDQLNDGFKSDGAKKMDWRDQDRAAG